MSYKLLVDSKYGPKDIYERTGNEVYYDESDWAIAKKFSEFYSAISNLGMPDLISFEFNLGFDIIDQSINPNAETGLISLRWLIDYCVDKGLKLPEIIVHAENEQHKRDLKTIIKNSKEIYNI